MARKKVKDIEEEIIELEQSINNDNNDEQISGYSEEDLLSSGSSILNVRITGNVNGAFLKGTINSLVGASNTGKTWILYNACAEAVRSPNFSNYRIIVDSTESGDKFPITKYFGKKLESKLETAWGDRKIKGCEAPASITVEEWFDKVNEYLDEVEKTGNPIIYILDSIDGLTTEAQLKKMEEDADKREEGKEISGDYGDGKAKKLSAYLRVLNTRFAQTKSILFLISQEKDDMASLIPNSKTYAGGRSIKFFASVQLWFKSKGTVDATINGIKRNCGIQSKVQIKKNRLNGMLEKDSTLTILHQHGIDEVGDMIDYLLEEGELEGKTKITNPYTDSPVTKENLVRYIEDNELEEKLKLQVQTTFNKIKELISSKFNRKKRYE